MDIQTSDGLWRFQRVKRDILRCTFSKGGDIKNDSRLVQQEAISRLAEPDEIGVQIMSEGGTLRLTTPNNSALDIVEYSLKAIDVVRYSTGGEEPRVEIVKTVDGQRTQISNLHAKVERQAYSGMVGFQIPLDVPIFGLGQDETGILNKRDTKQYLY